MRVGSLDRKQNESKKFFKKFDLICRRIGPFSTDRSDYIVIVLRKDYFKSVIYSRWDVSWITG